MISSSRSVKTFIMASMQRKFQSHLNAIVTDGINASSAGLDLLEPSKLLFRMNYMVNHESNEIIKMYNISAYTGAWWEFILCVLRLLSLIRCTSLEVPPWQLELPIRAELVCMWQRARPS